jgi:ATP-dependent helicase/nuclease subunit A
MLTLEQRAVLESTGLGMNVLAGAGCGKTTTLVAKCRHLVEMNPAARFCAVSFTERSAEDLRLKLRTYLVGKRPSLVRTIHGLCSVIAQEFPSEAGIDGDEQMLSEEDSFNFWEESLQRLWLGDLPEKVADSLNLLLERESKKDISKLLMQVRSLEGFGAVRELQRSTDLNSVALGIIYEFVAMIYLRIKTKAQALDFDDLEKNALKALEFKTVQKFYQSRFDLVLVDEFQDTNPLQAEILKRICRPSFSNLVVVGDPKQSIYRFRQADLTVYEEFSKNLPVQLCLSGNFRSHRHLIDFTNEVMAPVFQASELEYTPLVASRLEKSELERSSLSDRCLRLEVSEPEELGAFLREQIEAGVNLSEYVLLLRKIRGNQKWIQGLTRAGIPIAVESGGLFFEDPRVAELICFLKWWREPMNVLSGSVFLRSPWVGVSDLELLKWKAEDPTLRSSFLHSRYPVAEVLKRKSDEIISVGSLLESLFDVVDEGVLRSELGIILLGLWHRAEELSLKGKNFDQIVGFFVQALEAGARSSLVPAPVSKGVLRVLTIHGSKGLEFERVIILDLSPSAKRAANAPLLFFDRKMGLYLSPKDEDGGRDEDAPLEMTWRSLEKKKELEESKRLFYVALTRAKEQLLLVTLGADSDKVVEREKLLKSDFWRGWVGLSARNKLTVLKGEPGKGVPPEKNEAQDPKAEKSCSNFGSTKWVRPRHSATEWTVLSRCERKYDWQVLRPQLRQSVLGSLKAESDSSELGIRIHALLARFQGLDSDPTIETVTEELKILERDFSFLNFQATPIVDWMRTAETLIRIAGRDTRVFPELGFEVQVEGQVILGSMDRVVLESDSLTLVDYKWTQKPKTLLQIEESYLLQLQIYYWALKQLEPEKEIRNVSVVNFYPGGVQEFSLNLTALQAGFDPVSFLNRIDSILSTDLAPPTRTKHCEFCDFRVSCEKLKD